MLLMIIYARMWRIGAAETLGAIASVVLGGALGLLSLLICYHPQNAMAVANPIEHMFAFTNLWNSRPSGEAEILSGALATALIRGLGYSLANHSFVFWPSHRPTLLLEWLAIAGLIVAWRRGDRLLPAQVSVLILAVWGLDAVFWLRGLKNAYFAYTDPLLIIAAALVAARFSEIQHARWTRTAAISFFAFYVGWAHADPIRMTLTHKNPQEDDCYWFPHYLSRVGPFPFCRS
jgi:hypothetical protein